MGLCLAISIWLVHVFDSAAVALMVLGTLTVTVVSLFARAPR